MLLCTIVHHIAGTPKSASLMIKKNDVRFLYDCIFIISKRTDGNEAVIVKDGLLMQVSLPSVLSTLNI